MTKRLPEQSELPSNRIESLRQNIASYFEGLGAQIYRIENSPLMPHNSSASLDHPPGKGPKPIKASPEKINSFSTEVRHGHFGLMMQALVEVAQKPFVVLLDSRGTVLHFEKGIIASSQLEGNEVIISADDLRMFAEPDIKDPENILSLLK